MSQAVSPNPRNSLPNNLQEFEKRIKTTLENYGVLLQECNKMKPIHENSASGPPEDNNIVQKLLQEHRFNKNQVNANQPFFNDKSQRTERFERENIFTQQETNRTYKDASLIEDESKKKSLALQYVSFSQNTQENNEDQASFKENILKDFTNQKSFLENKRIENTNSQYNLTDYKQKENIPLTNIYSNPLKIDDLMKETDVSTQKKENKSMVNGLKVEERLILMDIGKNLKLHQMNIEKQKRESAEFKETPEISEQSKALAMKSLRVQHNPDIIKRLLEDHKIAKV